MNRRFHRLIWLLLLRMVRRQRDSIIHLTRIKTAIYYVKGIQSARLALVGYLGLCLLRLIFGAGFVLVHAGLFLYLPGDMRTKGKWIMVLGGIYLLISIIVFAVLLSQRIWMRVSGANKAVMRAVDNR